MICSLDVIQVKNEQRSLVSLPSLFNITRKKEREKSFCSRSVMQEIKPVFVSLRSDNQRTRRRSLFRRRSDTLFPGSIYLLTMDGLPWSLRFMAFDGPRKLGLGGACRKILYRRDPFRRGRRRGEKVDQGERTREDTDDFPGDLVYRFSSYLSLLY